MKISIILGINIIRYVRKPVPGRKRIYDIAVCVFLNEFPNRLDTECT